MSVSRWSKSGVPSSRSMASSRSVSSRSGSFTVGKGISRLALDALKFALDGGEIQEEGDRFVHLQSELGERRYTKLWEDVDLALEEIHYCQEGLDIVRINALPGERGLDVASPEQVEQMKQMKDLINHDYLVLKLRPGEPKAEVVHIMAHKLRGGIHVSHIPSTDVPSVFHEGVRCFTVDCRQKRIRLEALVAILKEEDPDYSLRNANCWDYAKNTAKRLVKGCIDSPGTNSAEKARLQTEHDNLEANLQFRHFQNVAKSLLRNVTRNSSRVSSSAMPMALSSLPEAQNSLGVSNSSGVVIDRFPEVLDISSLPNAQNSSGVSNTEGLLDRLPRVLELSSPPADTSVPGAQRPQSLPNSSKALNASRSVDLLFSEPADPTGLNLSRALNVSRVMDSPRRDAPDLSSTLLAPPAPLVSSGKLCLQIVFLVLCLVINNLGLGPWASTLLGGSS